MRLWGMADQDRRTLQGGVDDGDHTSALWKKAPGSRVGY